VQQFAVPRIETTMMRVRPAIWLLALACDRSTRAEAPAPGPDASVPAATATEHDDGYRFPETDRAWTIDDYVRARDTLVAMEQEQPELLLEANGPRRDVFAKLATLEEVTRAASTAGDDLEALLALGDALAAIYKLYAARVASGSGYGREYVRLSAAYLRVAVLQTHAVVRVLGLTPAALRKDRVRLDGLLKLRYGLASSFMPAVRSALQAPHVVDPNDAIAALAPIASEVAALLLPEEIEAVRADLQGLGGAIGPADDSLQTMRAAFADPPEAAAIVVAFVDEHREHAKKQGDMLAAIADSMQAPLQIGAERGGTRYAFADGSFSAVFDVRPNAMEQVTPGENGNVTTKTLGIKDAVGFARSVTCIGAAKPTTKAPEAMARRVLDGMGAASSKRVRVSGFDAWESVVGNDQSEAIVRVVPRPASNCIIIAEYPRGISTTVRTRARGFVDSVRIAGSGTPVGVPGRVPGSVRRR
jgi:hypothetical protein